MIINEKQFFEELLDLSITELRRAADASASGDMASAEYIFAEYIKATLKPECLFKLPYNTDSKKPSNHMAVANDALENKFSSVCVPIDFGKGNRIDWRANP